MLNQRAIQNNQVIGIDSSRFVVVGIDGTSKHIIRSMRQKLDFVAKIYIHANRVHNRADDSQHGNFSVE